MVLLLLLRLQAGLTNPPEMPAPDCALVAGWTQEGEARAYDRETLFDYMNGNAEGYFAYGFTRMKGVSCRSAAGEQLVLDVSELGDADRAWGFFVGNRDSRAASEALGSGGQILRRRATLAKGRYYFEISADPDKDHRPALRGFVRAMLERLPGEAREPAAVSWFPPQGLLAGSLRLVPESLLGLRLLGSGFLAEYSTGRAFVAPAPSPESAAATLARLRTRFVGAVDAAGPGDEAFRARDAYLGGIILFRKGARLAGVANVPEGSDPLPLARALADRLP